MTTMDLLTRPGPYPSPLTILDGERPGARIIPCPACGEEVELAPLPHSPSIYHLLDLGISALGHRIQQQYGNHTCDSLYAIRQHRAIRGHPRYLREKRARIRRQQQEGVGT